MSRARNILFVMFDQLRWDYLGCYGHPHLHTPNIDRLAERGVRFNRAYVQSPLCGPSRMSTYTGRYVHSHGASWNNVPLKVGERTAGDYLRDRGMDCFLIGKTHMKADVEGMRQLGLEPDSVIGTRVGECGFDVFERDDGVCARGPGGPYDDNGGQKYNQYLNSRGYTGDNPWHDHANSAIDDGGNVLSGWFLSHSDKSANIEEQDSETPYLTRRAIEFMEQQGDNRWCCHLSFIKPHWPYIVPEPYHDLYGKESFVSPVRSDVERTDCHPVFRAMLQAPVSRAFSRDDVRDKVLTAYMGLIKQCDDQIGVLLDWMAKAGRLDDTMIVLTSDHGDYLGDHWMGEKTFFHDCAIRIPLIVYDPSAEADATRGDTYDHLVESIDLVPTFVDVAGGDAAALDHVLEGRSLTPVLHGTQKDPLREYAFCEYDYSMRPIADTLGLDTREARTFMVTDGRWKLIRFEGGFRPMLFDLENDPGELVDLGSCAAHEAEIARLQQAFDTWAVRPSQRTTISNAQLRAIRQMPNTKGIILGAVDEYDQRDATVCYRDRVALPWREVVEKRERTKS